MTHPAAEVLKATHGRFARVVYTNAKGETKTYQVRLGVHKHLTPNPDPSRVRPQNENVIVYSVTRGNTGYKTFVPEQIRSIDCGELHFPLK